MKRIIPTFEQYLFENPDTVTATRPSMFWANGGIPFGYDGEKMKIGDYGGTHGSIDGLSRGELGTPAEFGQRKRSYLFGD